MRHPTPEQTENRIIFFKYFIILLSILSALIVIFCLVIYDSIFEIILLALLFLITPLAMILYSYASIDALKKGTYDLDAEPTGG